jgi:hypothetical protein
MSHVRGGAGWGGSGDVRGAMCRSSSAHGGALVFPIPVEGPLRVRGAMCRSSSAHGGALVFPTPVEGPLRVRGAKRPRTGEHSRSRHPWRGHSGCEARSVRARSEARPRLRFHPGPLRKLATVKAWAGVEPQFAGPGWNLRSRSLRSRDLTALRGAAPPRSGWRCRAGAMPRRGPAPAVSLCRLPLLYVQSSGGAGLRPGPCRALSLRSQEGIGLPLRYVQSSGGAGLRPGPCRSLSLKSQEGIGVPNGRTGEMTSISRRPVPPNGTDDDNDERQTHASLHTRHPAHGADPEVAAARRPPAVEREAVSNC